MGKTITSGVLEENYYSTIGLFCGITQTLSSGKDFI
jgi:hypothetical protein